MRDRLVSISDLMDDALAWVSFGPDGETLKVLAIDELIAQKELRIYAECTGVRYGLRYKFLINYLSDRFIVIRAVHLTISAIGVYDVTTKQLTQFDGTELDDLPTRYQWIRLGNFIRSQLFRWAWLFLVVISLFLWLWFG